MLSARILADRTGVIAAGLHLLLYALQPEPLAQTLPYRQLGRTFTSTSHVGAGDHSLHRWRQNTVSTRVLYCVLLSYGAADPVACHAVESCCN